MLRIAIPALWLLISPLASSAVVISVTTTNDEISPFSYNGQCSLREAIQAANTDTGVDSCPAGSGADTILVPAGTYGLTITGSGENANQTGDLDVTEDVEIAGAGPFATVIDQDAVDRVLHLQCDAASPAPVTVTVRDLRLTDGAFGEGAGAGLFAQGCAFPVHVTLERVEVDNNLAGYNVTPPAQGRPGGGIGFDSAGQLTVRDSLVRNNTYFQQNTDFGSVGGGGVGVWDGNALIVDSVLRDNDTRQFFSSGNPSGAGLWTQSFTEIVGTTFESNRIGTAGLSGGLYCRNSVLTVDNSTFFDNEGNGGGAFANGLEGEGGCLVFFDSVTMINNHARSFGGGGGIFNQTGGIEVTNSIVAGNTDASGLKDVSGAFSSGDYNLIGAVDGSTGFSELHDLTGTAASPLDPVLGSLGAEGFAVPTIAPLAGSPALDSGGATPLTLDQRGLPRGSFGVATERGAAEVLNANYGVYLDVGTHAGVPSSAYAAAATAPGTWNSLDLGGPTPVVDRLGASNGVTATIATESAFGVGAGATDAARLFIDDARDCSAPVAWSIDFAGLPDGDYVALLYAPSADTRNTGDILVAGLPVALLPGESTDLDAGVSFGASPEFALSGGSLGISGSNASLNCAGIAGVQLLPEPDGAAGFLLAAAVLTRLSRRRAAYGR